MTTADFDYEDLGLVAGLEIHQQLDTATKLFCECPTQLREPEDADHSFTRYLHPTKSELGEIDDAALEESMVDREFEYLAYDTTCLVEEDDEPPHRIDREAMETALEIGQLMEMNVVDQVNVMRKIVVDGSNTTGFQRSMLVANDGVIETTEGARIELKGVQSLDDIDDLVRNEVRRQVELLGIADTLSDREASVGEPQDVTETFEDTDSGVIGGALDSGGAVQAVPLYGFDGLVGHEIQPDRRLGTEFSDHAKRHGAGGIFHTDELPAYGVTSAEVDALRETVGAGPEDAVALVADDPDTAELAIDAVVDRAQQAIEGIPEETRDAGQDATSRYLRPLPGAARMYPTRRWAGRTGGLRAAVAAVRVARRVGYRRDTRGRNAGIDADGASP